MTMFEYICKENPSKAIAVAQRYSNVTVGDAQTALKVFLHVMNKADYDTKSELLADLREIHPDAELYKDEEGVGFWQPGKMNYPLLIPESVEAKAQIPIATPSLPLQATPTMNATGTCGCGCGGPKMYNSTGSGETKADPSVQELKTESIVRKNVINIVIIAVLVVLVYKIFIKK